MSDGPRLLGVRHVLAIHERAIEEHGGDPGIRDSALRHSAIAMPGASFDGTLLHGSTPAIATAYLFHLCMNHPFVDGNKRTALGTAEVFLDVNGYELAATDDEVYALTMSIASSECSKEETVRYFESRCRRLSDSDGER